MTRDRDHDRAELDMVRQDVDLLLHLAPGARKQGSKYVAPCPIHQGARLNFHIRQGKDGAWQWRCFSECAGASGDVVDLMVALGSTFKGALAELGIFREKAPETEEQRWERRWARLDTMKRPAMPWDAGDLVLTCAAPGCLEAQGFSRLELLVAMPGGDVNRWFVWRRKGEALKGICWEHTQEWGRQLREQRRADREQREGRAA